MDIEYLKQWIGKEKITEAVLTVNTANLMQATLNRTKIFKPGEQLPPAWHWLYFHDATPADKLGIEGHAELGDFYPPIRFSDDEPARRMWAGGKFTFSRPLLLGDSAIKRSTIKSITPKDGRSGKLVFLLVEHEIRVNDERCLLEDQTIVYREPTGDSEKQTTTAPMTSETGEFSASYQSNPILLFRYSALTFNGHRIHYDVDFCRNHEGYPDLVVHGPLMATLILDLFYHQFKDKPIRSFQYRGQSPVFNPEKFTVHGTSEGKGWVNNQEGGLAMSSTIGY